MEKAAQPDYRRRQTLNRVYHCLYETKAPCTKAYLSQTLGLDQHVPEYVTFGYDILLHLSIGINNIRMALDCDVVLGGFLTDFFPPYMEQLKKYVAANNTFGDDGDYVQLSALRHHSVPLGAALFFIQNFLREER